MHKVSNASLLIYGLAQDKKTYMKSNDIGATWVSVSEKEFLLVSY
jgi:hypothetical protein